MTNAEFSTEFDVLYNNITSNQAPGLNDYEKSVFINKAQLQLVSEYFSKRLDNSEGGFDGSPRRQIDFSSIMEWDTLERITSNVAKFDPRSILYAMPDDALFPVDEQVSLIDYNSNSYSQADVDTFYSVVPISYEDYARLMSKPYKYPPKNQAWRLITKTVSLPAETETVVTWTQNSGSASVVSGSDLIFSMEYKSYPQSAVPVKLVVAVKGTDVSQYTSDYIIVLVEPHDTLEMMFKAIEQSGIVNIKLIPYVNVRDRVGIYWDRGVIFVTTCSGSTMSTSEITTNAKDVQVLELIGKFPTTPYYRMRYVRRPRPVILSSLAGFGVTIGGITTVQTCELPEEVHHEILERAVTLAKISWQGATMTQTALAVQASK